MSPYLYNLPRRMAHNLALIQLIYNPDKNFEEFKFDGADVGMGDDEEVTVTYTRRRKLTTRLQEMYIATPVPEYQGAP